MSSGDNEDVPKKVTKHGLSKGNKGSSKAKLPPFGTAERPRPEVSPTIAHIFRIVPCPPQLIPQYGYEDVDEYYRGAM